MPFFGGHYGGLAPSPGFYGGRAPREALFLEAFKRAFPDAYSRDNASLVVAEHIEEARAKGSIVRAIEAIVKDSLPSTSHLSLRDWANKQGITILPTWTEYDLARACFAKFSAQQKNDIITLRENVAELLGDSFVALKRTGDQQSKVVTCAATSSGSTAGLVPVYPLAELDSNTDDGTSAVIAHAVMGPVLSAGSLMNTPGAMSAQLGVAIADDSVWVASTDSDTANATGTISVVITETDAGNTLLVFVVIESGTIDFDAPEFDSNPMTLLGSVTADDGVSDTNLHVAAYISPQISEGWASTTVTVPINTLDGTSPNAKVFVIQLEGGGTGDDASTQTNSTTDIVGGYRLVTEHTIDTDAEPTLTAPEPTYWPGNPAPDDVALHLLDGWTSARARYHLLARRGDTYTSDDAVRQRIDGAVHDYFERTLKSTECYDYSIGDLEGFILGQSRLGYVAMRNWG